MKEKIIQLLLKWVPALAKKIWPHLRDSLVGNKTPNIVAFRDEPGSKSIILFVHGFSGEAETTFGNIPKYLSEDEKMNGWNMFSIGYSTNQMPSLGIGIWAAIPDLTKLSDFFTTTITGQFKKYDRIAVIAHSMGGLVVQRGILDLDPDYRKKISYLLLFGVPSNGLIKAGFVKFVNRQLRDMGHDGEFIKGLRAAWAKAFTPDYPFHFKVVAGTDDEFVPTASSQDGFDKKYCKVVSGNHLMIVKPENKNHPGYQLILSELTDSPFIDAYSDKTAVNFLLGNYTATVNQLLPDKDKLDKQGLVSLIFALEGLGRGDEAVEILTNSPIAAGNSDLLGILGGRYKRKYLNSFEAAAADKALSYYNRGLEMAAPKNDNAQILFQAINLAFLSLVYKENKADMQKYAQMALDAASAEEAKSIAGKSIVSLWTIATVAEANMYLGNMERAKEYYTKAATLADVRQKLSIYANAYKGYVALKESLQEDDFIAFLKAKFLS